MRKVLRVALAATAMVVASGTPAWGLAYTDGEPPTGVSEPTPPSVVSPPAATPAAPEPSGGSLPVTGTDVVALAGIGAGAVLAGAVVVRGRRRLAPVA